MKSNLTQIIPFKITHLFIFFGILIMLGSYSCNNSGSEEQTTDSTPEQAIVYKKGAEFNADSAFLYVQKQCEFGPRVPNTPAHAKCLDYYEKFFKAQGAEVMIQKGKMKDYSGSTIEIKNLIASINPKAETRIMLSAHWDSRPRADEDSVRQTEPISGANDGASGVGVLMEITRLLKSTPPTIGIDIFLWDAEDGGSSGNNESWCLGSQYWAANKHKPNYTAKYGINLDMVGAKNATFPREQVSVRTAPSVVDNVWQTAHRMGYGGYFPIFDGNDIVDDHYFVNKGTQIPYIDIIHLQLNPNKSSFFQHWHTHGDKIEVIDKATLKAVGQTLMEVIANEK